MHISRLENLRSIWYDFLAMLSVTKELKNIVIFFSSVAQLSRCFTKITSCSDPLNSVISTSWRWLNKSSLNFQSCCSSQMQPGGHSVCSWQYSVANMCQYVSNANMQLSKANPLRVELENYHIAQICYQGIIKKDYMHLDILA